MPTGSTRVGGRERLWSPVAPPPAEPRAPSPESRVVSAPRGPLRRDARRHVVRPAEPPSSPGPLGACQRQPPTARDVRRPGPRVDATVQLPYDATIGLHQEQ